MSCVKYQTELVLLFLALSCSVLAASDSNAYAVKDAPDLDQNTKEFGPDLVTSFHYGKQMKPFELPKVVAFSQNGGTVTCTDTVTRGSIFNPGKPCGGYGMDDMEDTYVKTWAFDQDPFANCAGTYCMSGEWQTWGYPPTVKIGNTPYNWVNGTMYACIGVWWCSEGVVSWSDHGVSDTFTIRFIPANTPITIIASYYYLSAQGNMVKETIYQNVMKGYG